MSTKGFVDALNREGITAIVRLINLISPPILIYIGTVFIGKADTIIENQKNFKETLEIHASRINADSVFIAELKLEDIKLHRFDRLFKVKQDAIKDALQVNSIVGKEWLMEYDIKYSEKLNENNYLNP